MEFLKILFWVLVTVLLVLFAVFNWTIVTLNLWGGLKADVKLPVLVLVAFLLGFLPTLLVYGTRVWSLRRRLDTQAGPASNSPPQVRNAPAPPETTPRSNL